MSFIIAILMGFALPAQTGVNTRLRQRVGNPIGAALISFTVGTLFLAAASLVIERDLSVITSETLGAPFWIWIGGCLGAVVVTGNIPLMSALGSVQTSIFPIAGQIAMGLVIDHYGLFGTSRIPASPIRIAGAVLAFAGLLTVTLSRNSRPSGGGTAPGSSEMPPAPSAPGTSHASGGKLWLLRLAGIGIGVTSACQAAINGRLGTLLDSSLKSSLVSFTVGAITLLIINILMRNRINIKGEPGRKDPWWIWTGGVFGGLGVLGTVYFVKVLGVGLTVLATTGGVTCASVLIDRFGFFGAEKKEIGVRTAVGLVMLIAGAAVVKLL